MTHQLSCAKNPVVTKRFTATLTKSSFITMGKVSLFTEWILKKNPHDETEGCWMWLTSLLFKHNLLSSGCSVLSGRFGALSSNQGDRTWRNQTSKAALINTTAVQMVTLFLRVLLTGDLPWPVDAAWRVNTPPAHLFLLPLTAICRSSL